jgi:DNA topoisomerase VI subunit B
VLRFNAAPGGSSLPGAAHFRRWSGTQRWQAAAVPEGLSRMSTIVNRSNKRQGHVLQRVTFSSSRLLDFFSRKELIAQSGHEPEVWPVMAMKELVDNSIDSCEDKVIVPEIRVQVDGQGIAVADNGPGIPKSTIKRILDFNIRVSSREAYVSPTRGSQGNAMKVIVAMPFVLDGERGSIEIISRGVHYLITVRVDPIKQKPIIECEPSTNGLIQNGTIVKVLWPSSACSILERAKAQFVQIAQEFGVLNPHLTMVVDWFGEQTHIEATNRAWQKWGGRDPTSPHWYDQQRFERLIALHLAEGIRKTVRELISEFAGLKRSEKQTPVLDATGLQRMDLRALQKGEDLDHAAIRALLTAMKDNTKPVKPAALGIIGKDHFEKRFTELGAHMDSFEYGRRMDFNGLGLPFVFEMAFAAWPDERRRRWITGINWSPGIVNPFRELGTFGQSLDDLLGRQWCDSDENVVLACHLAYPRAEFRDRGKSAIVL